MAAYTRCRQLCLLFILVKAEFPKSLFLGCDSGTAGDGVFDNSVICPGEYEINVTRSAFEQICRYYRTLGSPHYINDIVLAVTADARGVTDEAGVGLVLEYRSCFDRLWIGTAQNFTGSDRYCTQMLDKAWRKTNIELSTRAAHSFVTAFPHVEFEWYVTYEANLNYFGAGCSGISGDILLEAYSEYISNLSAALNGVKKTQRLLWSPNFWSPVSGVNNRTQLADALARFASATPAITDLHFQDDAHAGHTCEGDGVIYYNMLKHAMPAVDVKVNLEMFLPSPNGGVGLAKGDPWAQERREACYDAHNISAGASWALKWWYLTWFGNGSEYRSSASLNTEVVASQKLFQQRLQHQKHQASQLRPVVQPIRGTFLDIQYDNRLKYANNISLHLTCAQWREKVQEFSRMGMKYLIFQAVHDDRFGAYYNSTLHRLWRGTCQDVVGTIMQAASAPEVDIQIWLSCEYPKHEGDSVSDPNLMSGRHAIMSELVREGYTSLPSFHGWYFSSEAYLTTNADCSSCFTPDFMSYINKMSNWSRALTPGAKRFISPFGTSTASVSPYFIKQLQQLDVDVVAYQDEVGCARDELPVQTSKAAFSALQNAHSYPNTPLLWANIESFTWEVELNYAQSALIPAAFPRILTQLHAVSALVDTVITFTAQSIYQPPPKFAQANVSWGPPSAVREWSSYTSTLGIVSESPPSLADQVLLAATEGHVNHAAIGWPVMYGEGSSPDPAMAKGNLTDGLTGEQTPWDIHWVGFEPGKDVVVVIAIPPYSPPVRSVGVHFLAVPPLWFRDGDHTKPVARNLTAWLPSEVRWAVSNHTNTGPWQELDSISRPDWWEREVYDIRTEVYVQELDVTTPYKCRYLRMTAVNAPPPWWAEWYKDHVGPAGGPDVGRIIVDELLVNFGTAVELQLPIPLYV